MGAQALSGNHSGKRAARDRAENTGSFRGQAVAAVASTTRSSSRRRAEPIAMEAPSQGQRGRRAASEGALQGAAGATRWGTTRSTACTAP
eukprot:1066714-Pyramimonas_sp.AAC.1